MDSLIHHSKPRKIIKKPVIAIAQIKYYDISKSNNIEKIRQFIRKAKRKGADIVCFPESCINKTQTIELEHRLIGKIQEECKKNSIWCIISDDIRQGKKSYSMAILIDRRGRIKGTYKKIKLYGDDASPGKMVRVFDTDFGKISIVLCWDLVFPDLFRRIKKAGAEIVFCPARWWYESQAYDSKHKEKETELLKSFVMARAFENFYFVALCNPVMDAKEQVSYSVIASPQKVLAEIKDEEGLITAKLNFKEIKRLKKVYTSQSKFVPFKVK